MHYSDSHHILVTISDNGKGLPKDFDSSQANSLGMSLVTGLVKQLEGEMEMFNKEGLKIFIKFPYDRNSNSVEAENGIALNTIV
jgi:two-component sensor histidine kinase